MGIQKPFLRWAGGKSWLIKHLTSFLPRNFNSYHEPFLGGGSVFFNVPKKNAAYLSDANADLISTYAAVRDDVDSVVKILKRFENTREDYYRIRSETSNNPFYKAAKFIYLNHTSFNGIYRVNRNGEYNVPFGCRLSKDYIQEDLLRKASLSLRDANLICRDFEESLNEVQENDFVFIDPPYTVAHNNNGFIAYNQKLFSLDDQYRLNQLLKAIKNKGAFFLMTNAYHHKIFEIYGDTGNVTSLERASRVGGRGAKRQIIQEYVIHNIDI